MAYEDVLGQPLKVGDKVIAAFNTKLVLGMIVYVFGKEDFVSVSVPTIRSPLIKRAVECYRLVPEQPAREVWAWGSDVWVVGSDDVAVKVGVDESEQEVAA